MTVKGMIFDLDGTLVDTLEDLTDSMNAALAQLGRPQRSPEACRKMIGYGLRRFAEQALGPEAIELTDELVARMVDHYQDHCLEKTTPYDGIQDVIANLAKQGIRLGMLTNKNQAPAAVIARHYFGTGTFDPIIGAADGRKVKPDPQTTFEILQWWNLRADEVLFAGDSETDVQTARNAGVRCIGCEWGFRSRDQLKEAGADMLIQHPGQILDCLSC